MQNHHFGMIWYDMYVFPTIYKFTVVWKSHPSNLSRKKTGREASKTHPLTMRTQFCQIFLGVIYIIHYNTSYNPYFEWLGTRFFHCSKVQGYMAIDIFFSGSVPTKMPPNSIQIFFLVLKFQPFSLRPWGCLPRLFGLRKSVVCLPLPTWRIIPISKWFITMDSKSRK